MKCSEFSPSFCAATKSSAIAVIKRCDQSQPGVGLRLILPRLSSRNIRSGTQGRNPEEETEAEAAEEKRCLLACFPRLAQRTFLYNPEPPAQGWLSILSYTIQNHLPRHSNTHNGLGLPTSVTNQENAPQPCLQANLVGAFFQLDSSFLNDSSCVKLT